MVTLIEWCWGTDEEELNAVMARVREKYGPSNVITEEVGWDKIKRRRAEKIDDQLEDKPLPRLDGPNDKEFVGVVVIKR